MKYMGSKSRIAKYIVPIIQKYIDDNNIQYYYEPFVGGANVIDKIQCEHRCGSDLNPYLIGLLSHVANGEKLLDEVPRELYSEVRSNYKSGVYEDWYVGNVGFLASYNGRFFDGGYAQSGYEKLKNGGVRYRDYYRESKDNILAQNLNCIEFSVSDYRDCVFPHISLIYCDVPYNNTKKYSNSTEFDYDEYWQWVRDMSKEHIVICSEENAPDDFDIIWQQEVSRSIKVTDKSKSTEKLFIWRG